MIDAFCHMLFLMLAGHALADGPLQNGHVAAGKASPRRMAQCQALLQHGLMHGGAVALVTGLWWLGAAETVAHALIDLTKMRGRISHLTDQALHLVCKIGWAVIVIALAG